MIKRMSIVPTSRLCRPRVGTPRPTGARSPKRSAQSEGCSNSLDSTLAKHAANGSAKTAAEPWLPLQTSARPSPVSAEQGSARPAGLCRPRDRETPAPQGIPRQRRHNPKVGTIGVVPTSAQRRICVMSVECPLGSSALICAFGRAEIFQQAEAERLTRGRQPRCLLPGALAGDSVGRR